ncbi:MAG: glutamyl-tRNA reductase [Actinomycetota bacterium]|nr:glutamyl-tRNA reductase [Actinomycetota bacterium]
MSLVVVGLNHRTAPISLLERLSIPEEELPKALAQLGNYEHVLEGAILSTCNRIEVYAVVSKFHGGAQDLRNFLAEFCHVAPEDFVDHLYTYHEEGAVRHLFRVGSGIDSMVVGESEILGQVRRAFGIGADEGMVGRYLGRAFQQALRVGKRSRTETAIGRNPVSVSSAAVELARKAFPEQTLAGKRVLVVGAGKMGKLAMRALAHAGASGVTIVNRTEDRAERLAGEFEARSLSFDQLGEALAEADIVLSSTTAPQTVVDRKMVEAALERRGGDTSLLLVDIAVPRDVESDVVDIPGVVVRDLDDLRGVVEGNIGSRIGEVVKVEDIVTEELDHFLEWEKATEMAPTVAALVSSADGIRVVELEKTLARLRHLSPEDRIVVDHLSRRIVSKLLHGPIKRAKELSSGKQGHVYLDALRELFDIEDDI